MLCQRCKQKEATTHMTKIINGYTQEMHLCEDCAAVSPEFKELKTGMDFGISDFLGGIFGGTKQKSLGGTEQSQSGMCPTCGMAFAEFLNNGKMGCGQCYEVFKSRMMRPLKQIHGTYEHVGKVPARIGGGLKISKQIAALETELNEAVQKQDFEHAAELRDQIKELKTSREIQKAQENQKKVSGEE